MIMDMIIIEGYLIQFEAQLIYIIEGLYQEIKLMQVSIYSVIQSKGKLYKKRKKLFGSLMLINFLKLEHIYGFMYTQDASRGKNIELSGCLSLWFSRYRYSDAVQVL